MTCSDVILLDDIAFGHSHRVRFFGDPVRVELLFISPFSMWFKRIEEWFIILKRNGRSTRRFAEALSSETSGHIFVLFPQVLFPPGRSLPKGIKHYVYFKMLWDELGCTLQKFDIEKSQRNASAIEKYGELTEPQMAPRTRVRGLFALASLSGVMKRIKFVRRDQNAAINIGRCPVLNTRPEELRRDNLVG